MCHNHLFITEVLRLVTYIHTTVKIIVKAKVMAYAML